MHGLPLCLAGLKLDLVYFSEEDQISDSSVLPGDGNSSVPVFAVACLPDHGRLVIQ